MSRGSRLNMSSGEKAGHLVEYVTRNVGGKTYVALNRRGAPGSVNLNDKLVVGGKPTRVGVMVATQFGNGSYGVGFSLTNTNAGDRFDPALGVASALVRAQGIQASPSVPDSIKDEWAKFSERAAAYFKDRDLAVSPPVG